jgi:hypothetical protein
LWVIFALLDPDPDSESGSTDPIESGSNPDPDTDPDPQPCIKLNYLKKKHTTRLCGGEFSIFLNLLTEDLVLESFSMIIFNKRKKVDNFVLK